MKRINLALAAALLALMPNSALACACGCGVFDVGTGSMMPTDTGGQVWFEYDFMNQITNWHNSSESPKADNTDKLLRSNFFQAGGEYMFNRNWGIMGEVPLTDRFFKTANDDTGDIGHFRRNAIGDVHLQAIYSGYSEDMSTGMTFGFKIPTGDFTYPNFDRDVQIGTGSLDTLIGGYHMGMLDSGGLFNWFTNGVWDHAVLMQDSYRPGDEVDASLGSYYNGFDIGKDSKIAPLLQLVGSWRWRDSGAAADPQNTGYRRLMISPGLEYDVGSVKLYGDAEVPFYQHVNGQQIVAPVYFKFIVGYSF